MMAASTAFLGVGEGHARRNVVVRARKGHSPGLVWLAGFTWHQGNGPGFGGGKARAGVRFDYSRRGQSGGNSSDGAISRWLEEGLAVFEAYCDSPQILVGSSMGGSIFSSSDFVSDKARLWPYWMPVPWLPCA
jgi:hypothetical protein